MSTDLATAPTAPVSANERSILDLVRRSNGMTRARLARETGLTAQSISRLVDSLTQRGLVVAGERIASGRGQPSVIVRLREQYGYSIGLSLMTDAIACVLMDFSGSVARETSITLPGSVDQAQILSRASEAIDALLEPGNGERERIVGLGVGITGFFVNDEGWINPPEPLQALGMTDIKGLFADRFGWPVWVDNDGNVAAMGESLTGVGLEYDTFAYIFLSTGIGGSVVIDNRVYSGAYGNAGEFAGILPEDKHDERPSLELLRKIITGNGVDIANVNELAERFDPYWPGIDEWMSIIRPHLQSIVSSISAVLDPQAIVLGGRIPKALAERVIADIRFFNVPRRGHARPTPALLSSRVAGDAAAIGAAAMPLKAKYFL